MTGEHNQYTQSNETLRNQSWDAISIDDGIVALPDDYVAQEGLPVSQRLPWDTSKGIYLINAHHNLHCVVGFHFPIMFYAYLEIESRTYLFDGVQARKAPIEVLEPCYSLPRCPSSRGNL